MISTARSQLKAAATVTGDGLKFPLRFEDGKRLLLQLDSHTMLTQFASAEVGLEHAEAKDDVTI